MTEAVQDFIDTIQLFHVDGETIDIGDIITEDGPQAHIKFALYLIQVQYRKIVASIVSHDHKEPTRAMKERALLYARHATMSWLLRDGKGLIDRTTAYLMEEAERTGWFRSDYFSWDSIEEFVASCVDATEDDSSEHWAWLTFAKKIVPAAKAAGIETGLLMSSSLQVKKLRHSLVPAWNELEERMKLGAVSEDKGQDTFRWMLELAANPTVTYPQMKEEVDTWRGVTPKLPEPLEGLSVLVNENETIYLVVSKSRVEAHLVEMALRNKANLEVVGLKTFIKLTAKLMGAERMSRLYEAEGQTESISNSGVVE